MENLTCPCCLGKSIIQGFAAHIAFASCIDCGAEWDERERQPTALIAWEHFKSGMEAAGYLVKQDMSGHLVLISTPVEGSGYKEAHWPFSKVGLEKLGWSAFAAELAQERKETK